MHGNTSQATVLVIDDDEGVRETIQEMLLDQGYDVLIAEDGRIALEILERTTPAVIVLDLMMPRMDGFSFTQQLEQRGIRTRTPILVLTAAGGARPMVAQMGADGYLEKPFDMTALLNEVARLAGGRVP